MTELIFTIAILAWYGFSLYFSEIAGRNSKIGVEYLFFISMVFSPLIAYVVVKMSKKSLTKQT